MEFNFSPYYFGEYRDYSESFDPFMYRNHQQIQSDDESYENRASTSSSFYSSSQSYPSSGSNSYHNQNRRVEVFTAGSCFNNGCAAYASAGYGICFPDYPRWDRSRYCKRQHTNQRAELEAAIYAIEFALSRGIDELLIITHSGYLLDNLGKVDQWQQDGWLNRKYKPVKNPDLWNKLDKLLTKCDVIFRKIRRGDYECNQIAYELARNGAERAMARAQRGCE